MSLGVACAEFCFVKGRSAYDKYNGSSFRNGEIASDDLT